MAIEEKIADLLYALAEIQHQTDNARVQLIAEAMEVTAMEMEALIKREVGQPLPKPSL